LTRIDVSEASGQIAVCLDFGGKPHGVTAQGHGADAGPTFTLGLRCGESKSDNRITIRDRLLRLSHRDFENFDGLLSLRIKSPRR